MKSTNNTLIVLGCVLTLIGCRPPCGFDEEPYMVLDFMTLDSCLSTVVFNNNTNMWDSTYAPCYAVDNPGYEYIEGENLKQDLGQSYGGVDHEGSVQLPIDMNRDSVLFFLHGQGGVDTLQVRYRRTFERQSRRCGVVCFIYDIVLTTNLNVVDLTVPDYENDADPPRIEVLR